MSRTVLIRVGHSDEQGEALQVEFPLDPAEGMLEAGMHAAATMLYDALRQRGWIDGEPRASGVAEFDVVAPPDGYEVLHTGPLTATPGGNPLAEMLGGPDPVITRESLHEAAEQGVREAVKQYRCATCGARKESTIHMVDSTDPEISTAAHEFRPGIRLGVALTEPDAELFGFPVFFDEDLPQDIMVLTTEGDVLQRRSQIVRAVRDMDSGSGGAVAADPVDAQDAEAMAARDAAAEEPETP